MNIKEDYNYNAINIYRSQNQGILSTFSHSKENYPFGSFVTFISGLDRTTYLYLSDIAEHTKNLKYNPKACITLSNVSTIRDKQDSERLSIIGDLKKLNTDLKYYKNRFESFFPESKKYSDFHSFNLYRLEIKHLRWIGGFGKIAWLNVKLWDRIDPKWKKDESKIIEHMNDDHNDVILQSLYFFHNIDDNAAKMLYLTLDGYYIESKYGIFFIQFDEICLTTNDYKEQLIKLSKEFKNRRR